MNFVILDVDQKLSAGQKQLLDRYYRNVVPHVVILDPSGKALYNEPGEVEESRVSGILDQALRGASRKPGPSNTQPQSQGTTNQGPANQFLH